MIEAELEVRSETWKLKLLCTSKVNLWSSFLLLYPSLIFFVRERVLLFAPVIPSSCCSSHDCCYRYASAHHDGEWAVYYSALLPDEDDPDDLRLRSFYQYS